MDDFLLFKRLYEKTISIAPLNENNTSQSISIVIEENEVNTIKKVQKTIKNINSNIDKIRKYNSKIQNKIETVCELLEDFEYEQTFNKNIPDILNQLEEVESNFSLNEIDKSLEIASLKNVLLREYGKIERYSIVELTKNILEENLHIVNRVSILYLERLQSLTSSHTIINETSFQINQVKNQISKLTNEIKAIFKKEDKRLVDVLRIVLKAYNLFSSSPFAALEKILDLHFEISDPNEISKETINSICSFYPELERKDRIITEIYQEIMQFYYFINQTLHDKYIEYFVDCYS